MVWILLWPLIVAAFVTDKQWFKDVAFRGGGLGSVLAVLVGIEYWPLALIAVGFVWLSAWIVAIIISALKESLKNWQTDRFGIVLVAFFCLTTMAIFEGYAEKLTLTPEEHNLIGWAVSVGIFNQPGAWAKLQERLRNDPRREGAVERALFDRNFGIRREFHGIGRGFMDPSIGIDASKKYFQQHGIVSGVWQISYGAAISSLGGAEDPASYDARPLERLVGLTTHIRWLFFKNLLKKDTSMMQQ
ncbi:MAG: hypothetical protein OXI67_02075 [Candidatus Poribacteria bacterium]|nr:hypothetical protein [Candidatus Poribacteria bacterium]